MYFSIIPLGMCTVVATKLMLILKRALLEYYFLYYLPIIDKVLDKKIKTI